MDQGSAFALMDIIILAAGAYVFYAWYLLMFKNEVKDGLLVTKGTMTKQCKDLPAYKSYMGARTLILGLMCLVSGGIGLYQDYVDPLPQMLYWILFSAFMVIVIWYAYCAKKAQKKYFSNI